MSKQYYRHMLVYLEPHACESRAVELHTGEHIHESTCVFHIQSICMVIVSISACVTLFA